MKFPTSPSGQGAGGFELPEAGAHRARLIRITDIGLHESEYQGQKSTRSQVVFEFELPDEIGSQGRPLTVSKWYTKSMYAKANLRRDLEAWRGKTFSDAEVADFDPAALLGKVCLLTIQVNERTDRSGTSRQRADITAIAPLPKQMQKEPVPEMVNTSYIYDMDHHDPAVFEMISPGLKRKIESALDYAEKVLNKNRPGALYTGSLPADLDLEDQIPF